MFCFYFLGLYASWLFIAGGNYFHNNVTTKFLRLLVFFSTRMVTTILYMPVTAMALSFENFRVEKTQFSFPAIPQ